MIVYESPYQRFEIFRNKRLGVQTFFDTQYPDDAAYKSDMIKGQTSAFAAFRPGEIEYVLSDLRKFEYIITPELQEWHNERIFQKGIAYGMRKMALLVSPEFYAQMSVEQTMEEQSEVVYRYFRSEKDAMGWLLKN